MSDQTRRSTKLDEFSDDEQSVKMVVDVIKQLNETFVRQMREGPDFTLRLEIRVTEGRVQHCKISEEALKRRA